VWVIIPGDRFASVVIDAVWVDRRVRSMGDHCIISRVVKDWAYKVSPDKYDPIPGFIGYTELALHPRNPPDFERERDENVLAAGVGGDAHDPA